MIKPQNIEHTLVLFKLVLLLILVFLFSYRNLLLTFTLNVNSYATVIYKTKNNMQALVTTKLYTSTIKLSTFMLVNCYLYSDTISISFKFKIWLASLPALRKEWPLPTLTQPRLFYPLTIYLKIHAIPVIQVACSLR